MEFHGERTQIDCLNKRKNVEHISMTILFCKNVGTYMHLNLVDFEFNNNVLKHKILINLVFLVIVFLLSPKDYISLLLCFALCHVTQDFKK